MTEKTKNFYKKLYDSFMQSRKLYQSFSKSHDYYYENHHIIPVSLGGLSDNDNLVLLTAREHYIAHRLLCKIAKNKNEKIKMIKALNYCCYGNNKQFKYLTAKQYEIAKLLYNNISISIETRKKMSESAKKRIRYPMSEEQKKKIGEANKISLKGFKQSEETKLKKSQSMTGKKFPEAALKRTGQKRTIEQKERMREAAKNKPPVTEETKRKQSEIHKNERKFECIFCGYFFNGCHLKMHHLTNCHLNPEHIYTLPMKRIRTLS